MAGALKEEKLLRNVYDSLQAVSCPLVEGLNFREADDILQLLCVPSQNRTNILSWICSCINPKLCKAMSMRSADQEDLSREMAALGQELMLGKADDLVLILEGGASVQRQLQFLQQLLTVVPVGKKPAGPRVDAEVLLNELYAAESLPHLSQMLCPTFDPWPAHVRTVEKGKVSSKPSRENVEDVSTVLLTTQSALEQLQSECEFFNQPQSPGAFCPSSLRVAASDLQQLMATFSHIYETDLRAYCSRDAPGFGAETDVFQRVHHLLRSFITELEMLKEVSETSQSVKEDLNQLQTRLSSRSRGDTLQDQLEELTKRIREVLPLLQS